MSRLGELAETWLAAHDRPSNRFPRAREQAA